MSYLIFNLSMLFIRISCFLPQYKQRGKDTHRPVAGTSLQHEYHAAMRGESWKVALAIQIDECMKYAVNKEQFIELMESEGYQVKWTDSRANITYTTPAGKRCRDYRLHDTKWGC